jgi:hypothetical protein
VDNTYTVKVVKHDREIIVEPFASLEPAATFARNQTGCLKVSLYRDHKLIAQKEGGAERLIWI